MDEIKSAILNECKSWAAEVVPAANAAKRSFKIHHNRVDDPFMSKMKFKALDDGIVKVSLKTSRGEIFTSKGIGRSPASREKKPWIDPVFEDIEELGQRCAERVADEITKYLKW